MKAKETDDLSKPCRSSRIAKAKPTSTKKSSRRKKVPKNFGAGHHFTKRNRGENQTLAAAIPYCGEYSGPRFEDKFRSANQMDGISKADEIRWLPVSCKQENMRNTV